MFSEVIKTAAFASQRTWGSVYFRRPDGLGVFKSALSWGDIKIAELIMGDSRFSVNAKAHNPLQLVIRIGCLELATIRLDAGANLHYRFDGGHLYTTRY